MCAHVWSDRAIAELEQRLPHSNEDERVRRDAEHKVRRLRTWLVEQSFDSVLISRRDNFAWLTMGGDSHVLKNTENGVGHLLVTRDRQYLLAYSMDGPRLLEEQLPDQGYELVTTRWYQDEPRLKALELGGKRIAADSAFPGVEDHSVEISRLHDPFTELEMDRCRWLGLQTGLVFETAAARLHPVLSEWEIARIFTDAFAEQQIELDVLLVGTDERAWRFRHVIPTGRRLEKYALLNPAARRWGLHANVSRCISFGQPPENLRRNYRDAAAIMSGVLGMLKPGLAFADVLPALKAWFSDYGYPAGWEQHFPGGTTGYVVADSRCHTEMRLVRNQAYDWFVTLPGVMVEELALLGDNYLEIPSLGKSWPLVPARDNNFELLLPDILVL